MLKKVKESMLKKGIFHMGQMIWLILNGIQDILLLIINYGL